MTGALATTLDPDGNRVVLSAERWEHIKEEHAILAGKLRDVTAAVREPVRRFPGRFEGEVWFFGENARRLPWIQVVVHYEGGEGWKVTAFPRKSLPGRP